MKIPIAVAVMVLAASSCIAGPITFTNVTESGFLTLNPNAGFAIRTSGGIILRSDSSGPHFATGDIEGSFSLDGYQLTGIQLSGVSNDDGNSASAGGFVSVSIFGAPTLSCGLIIADFQQNLRDCPSDEVGQGLSSGTFILSGHARTDQIPPDGVSSTAIFGGAAITLTVVEIPEPQPFILAFGGLALLTLIRLRFSH